MTPESENAGVPRRIWNATSLQVAGRLFGSACTFAVLALLARHLSVGEFGRYTFYLAVFGLLDSLTDFGTGAVSVQMTAGDPWALPGVLRTARRVRAFMALLGGLGLALGVWIGGEEGAVWIALAAVYELTHVFELSAVVFKNKIAWGVPVTARAFASLARLGAIVLLWKLGIESAAPFVLATAAGSSVANIALHFASRRHLPRPTIAVRAPSGFLAAALPLGLAGLCQQLYFYIDNVFVRLMTGEEPLGHYNAGVRVMSFLIMIAQYAGVTALPWLTRRQERGELGAAVADLVQPLWLLSAVGAGLAWPWAGFVLELLYGPDFAPSATSFRWLLLATVAIYAGSSLLTALVSTGGTRKLFAITALGLLVNVVGNAALVPAYGIEGAALATLATEILIAAGAVVALGPVGRTALKRRPLRWLAAPFLFAAALGLSHLAASWWIA